MDALGHRAAQSFSPGMKAAHGTAQGILRSSLGYLEAGLGEEQDLGVAKHLTALAFPLCWMSRAFT